MEREPSYLGLLRVVAITEWQAYRYLGKWLETTSDPEVQATLSTVVPREGEHAMAFAKRISELGYTVDLSESEELDAKIAVAGSSRSDLEKMEEFAIYQYYVADGPDVFDDWFKDHSIDITTAGLLGRHIAEERDSLRRISECRQALVARQPAALSTS
jgi:Mn-containing catalase